MRITMLPHATAAGPDVILHPGKTYNLGSEFGNELVKGGYAVDAKSTAKAERIPAQPDPGDVPEADESEEDGEE